MENKGKYPKAVGETDENVVQLNVKFLSTATDEELVEYCLISKILGKKFVPNMIREVDIYKHEPWDLPTLTPSIPYEAASSCLFFFFCPVVKNRETESGYWKKAGSSRFVMNKGGRTGFKQLLVYYRGKPPRGKKTDWIMYEFSLNPTLPVGYSYRGVDPCSFVLCRIYSKSYSYDPPHHGKVPVKTGGMQEVDGISVATAKEPQLMHNASSSVEPKMYVDGPTPLEFPVAWELFRSQTGDVIDSPEINDFAHQVVAMCCYSPLTISVVASALTEETDPDEWRRAAQCVGLRRISGTNPLNPFIRYCYDRLKDHDVKICFLYSALVLANKEIHISVLVKSFITEGLLDGMTMLTYKRANDIVRLLVKASLLEANNETMMIKMHTMIRDSALAILPSSIENPLEYSSYGWRNLGAPKVDKYLINVGAPLKEPPPLEEWEKAHVIFLMDNDFSTLPSKPNCPTLVYLFLQRNRYLRVIPTSFFDSMHSLTNLNLSQTRIRSLPNSLFTLKSLQVFLMRDCQHLIILPSAIGQLTALQVLDFQGTELLNLPDTIGELARLKILKVSFYGSINHSECNNLPRKLIGDGTISNLPLKELGMFVYPGDRRWTISVPDIIKEVTGLLLTTFYFHFPELESLEYFLQGSKSWKDGNLTDFNFIVGHDFKRALSLVTRDAELMHNSSKRCLRFVNGETLPQGVVEVLKRATSLYLDHHFSICFLSELGIDNMDALRICILSDCPELQAVIHVAEDGQVILPSLEYLSLNSLWNLEAIICGHHLLAEESFDMLTFLSLRACPKLTYVFTLSMMKNLPKLEELVVDDCVSLTSIISQEDLLGSDEFVVLPSLKVLKLYYLPNLSELGRLTWANVEYMHFYNCPKLKNLRITDDTANIKEIAADKAWWDSLEWDEPLLSERLDKLFTQIQLDDL